MRMQSKFLPTNPKYRRYIVENKDFKIKNNPAEPLVLALCENHPVITWDGRGCSLLFLIRMLVVMKRGSLTASHFKEIWHSKKLNEFRGSRTGRIGRGGHVH